MIMMTYFANIVNSDSTYCHFISSSVHTLQGNNTFSFSIPQVMDYSASFDFYPQESGILDSLKRYIIKYYQNLRQQILCNMTKREVVKIFFLALIAGTIMGIILIEIFGTLTLMKLFQLEICMIFIIVFLFISSRMWNKRLRNMDNNKRQQTDDVNYKD